jgi:hypothetical protein
MDIAVAVGWISVSASTIAGYCGGCAGAYPPYHKDINGILAISRSLDFERKSASCKMLIQNGMSLILNPFFFEVIEFQLIEIAYFLFLRWPPAQVRIGKRM